MLRSLFNEIAGPRPNNWCFIVKFVTFLRTHFYYRTPLGGSGTLIKVNLPRVKKWRVQIFLSLIYTQTQNERKL